MYAIRSYYDIIILLHGLWAERQGDTPVAGRLTAAPRRCHIPSMADLQSICVYCGANPGSDPRYREMAESLGQAMAAAGISVITSYSIHYTKLYDHSDGDGGDAPIGGADDEIGVERRHA